MSQSQQCVQIHLANKRRKKGNNIRETKELTKQEYKTFESVFKLSNNMKQPNNEGEFDENILTPFIALFCINVKRKSVVKDLKRYPKTICSLLYENINFKYNSHKKKCIITPAMYN